MGRITKTLAGGRRYDLLLYGLIAVSFLTCAWAIDRSAGPFTADPDFQYLLNGLDIVTLHWAVYIDHPGTPAETLVAITQAFTWLLTLPWHGFGSIADDVLRQPQFYMEAANVVFAFVIVGAILFFCRCVRQAGGDIAAAAVGLATMFPTYAPIFIFHRIMPEPILLAGALVVAGLVAKRAFDPDRFPQTSRYSLFLGCAIGFCLATKVTSLPLLLVILFLEGSAARWRALKAATITAIVLMLPAGPHVFGMLRRFIHIGTHRGNYGTGQAGLPSAGELWTNLQALAQGAPEAFLWLGTFVSVLVAFRLLHERMPGHFQRAWTVAALVVLGGILLVSRQPHPYYLTPTLPFIALGVTLLAALVLKGRPLRWAGLAVAALLVAWASDKTSAEYFATNHRLQDEVADRGCLMVPYYGADNAQYNLFFGNDTGGDTFSDRLSRLYPNFLTYSIVSKKFMTFGRELDKQEALSHFRNEKCVELVGSGLDEEDKLPSMRLVAQYRAGSVYELLPGWHNDPYGRQP